MAYKELEPFSAVVTSRLGNNLIFSSIKDASLMDLLPAHQAFSAARLDYSVNGGVIPRALLESTHMTLIKQLYLSSINVEGLAKGDVEIINASGYIASKTTRKTSSNKKEPDPVAAPTKFKGIAIDNKPGFVSLSWFKALSARTYGIESRVRGTEVWLNGDYTSNLSIELSGFEPGSIVEFRLRTYGKGETKSDYSVIIAVLIGD